MVGAAEVKPCRAACTKRETADVKHSISKLQNQSIYPPKILHTINQPRPLIFPYSFLPPSKTLSGC